MKLIVSFTLLFAAAKCSRILIVFPMVGRSHYILGNAFGKGLADAGHDVTMLSPFEDKKPPKNGKYTEVVLTGLSEEENKPKTLANLLDLENMNPFWYIPLVNILGTEITRNTFAHPNFQKLLKSNQTFDAVIIEQFNNDALKVLAHHYKAPLITFSTVGASVWVNPLVGNPSPPSYIPEIFFDFTHNMTFWQKLTNWLFRISYELNRHLIFFPAQNKLMHEYFPDAPDLSDIIYNSSVLFLNSHESINQPIPHVPCMIDIGGFHVNAPKELPKDLKDFLDGAEEGVVYFSMGSNIKPSQISDNQKKALHQAFGKIKQKVLWKWDEDSIEGKPDNVKLGKWFPQADILAHPNTKLFITHGGLLSTTETIYHGVPVLALPVFADQKMNAARATLDGYGLTIKLSELDEEKLSSALDNLLNDPRYRDNAKMRSNLMHDRPVKPMDLAVYWTEFVIKHKGAPHLRVAGVDLPWYKYLLLDVISFTLLCIISLLVIIYMVIKRILGAILKTRGKVKKN
ncbi:UDP-glucuronosyltransferase 2B7-like [Anoplophora glabripennis]|uniref:UDP-glucuronosyltransferase 2B7-like n=1 Tax=Anoplophora glabripennis TaxID=217634 RepID=UPI000874CB97|nr:UDP-glucuronosyltransferase 2B7-like [Anoplophora glabripennis]